MDSETQPIYIGFPEVPYCSTLFPCIDDFELGPVVEPKVDSGESSQRKRTWSGDEGHNIMSERSQDVLQPEKVRKLMHSASEKRRRERIKQRINTIKELIPDCNKTGDAEILEAAAEYMQWMQLQIQMMSIMGYSRNRNQVQEYHGVPWWTCQPHESQATVAMTFPGAYEALPTIQQPMQYLNPFQQQNLDCGNCCYYFPLSSSTLVSPSTFVHPMSSTSALYR